MIILLELNLPHITLYSIKDGAAVSASVPFDGRCGERIADILAA